MNQKIAGFIRNRSFNIPLLIGFLILALLVLASFYPEYLSPADPYGVQRLSYENQEGTSGFLTPPIPPNKDYPWGTDERGRDMRSLIVYGTKLTMLVAVLVAFFRLLIALPLAAMAAYQNKKAIWLIQQFKILFSAMPLLIAVIFLSKIALFSQLIKNPSVQSGIWLILLGWSPMALQLKQKISEVLQQDFIEGEIAIGKNRWEIAVQNILPHIIPTIIVLLFLEIAIVLLLMSQLGVLGLTFGGGYYNAEGGLAVPNEFDWASLLSFSYALFGTGKIWVILFPAAAFALSVIGFNLFGEGLRIEFDKRDSRVITYLKKVPSFFSPKMLYYEFKNRQIYMKSLRTKLCVYFLILTLAFFPVLPSRYVLNADDARSTVMELTGDKYQGRHTGTAGMKDAAQYVAGRLEAYGIKPLNGRYINEFPVENTYNVRSAKFTIYTSTGKEIEFRNRNDFYAYSTISRSEKLEVMTITPEDVRDFSMEAARSMYGKILLYDTRIYTPQETTSTLMMLSRAYQPSCLIMIHGWDSGEDYLKRFRLDKTFQNTVTISFSSDMGDELLKYKELTASYEVEVDRYHKAEGYNVLGYIPGSNPELADECLVIGSTLDYVGDDEDMRYPGALSAGAVALELEIARILAESSIKPERTILFAFWDGMHTDYRGTKYFIADYLNKSFASSYYVDLTYFVSNTSDYLMLDTSKTIPRSKQSQSYIKAFKGVARAKNAPVQYGRLSSNVLQDFMGTGKEMLIFGSSEWMSMYGQPKILMRI